ncbi:MAG: hypothetical protein QNJ40_12895 [Xanthomonadales bacterium]|nr:hypothetical protein [Xanthomonadales bacterium]
MNRGCAGGAARVSCDPFDVEAFWRLAEGQAEGKAEDQGRLLE